MDHLGGRSIRRSPNCELLVADKENDPGNECKFCAFVDIDMMDQDGEEEAPADFEDLDQVEIQ